jgi:DNA mismatch repair protein MutS
VFFTQLALENKYVCPDIDESFDLEIKMEDTLLSKTTSCRMPYIANDVFLDRNTAANHDYRSQYVW